MRNRIGNEPLESFSNDEALYFIGKRDPVKSKSRFGITSPWQAEVAEGLCHIASSVGLTFIPDLLPWVEKGLLLYENESTTPNELVSRQEPPRVHLIGLGDVGAHCALGLRLLGENALSLGLYSRKPEDAEALAMELSHIRTADPQAPYPNVTAVEGGELTKCEYLLFAASAGVPEKLEPGQDVRMMQYEKNKEILKTYLEKIREEKFCGILLILSDPVDALCNFAAKELEGFLPRERILGLGLGVMYARAYAYATEIAPEFAAEGAAYGPHGEGLWIANSVSHYDDDKSAQLTKLTKEANLAIRALGAKPYYGPALSSGALSVLSLLRGKWFHGAAPLSDVYFGSRIRVVDGVLYASYRTVPARLENRLMETLEKLREVKP